MKQEWCLWGDAIPVFLLPFFHFQAAAARDTMHDNCKDLPEDLIRNALKITVLYRIQEKEV